MRLANYCPGCGKRRWLADEGVGRLHYPPRGAWKQMWRAIYGSYPMGDFYKSRCELCRKLVAVFDQHSIRGMEGKPIVLFTCTLSDQPQDKEECIKYGNCYSCPIPKIQEKTNTRMWSTWCSPKQKN